MSSTQRSAEAPASETESDPKRPELIFGLVAPVGTPLNLFVTILEEKLQALDYSATPLRLSGHTGMFELPTSVPPSGAREATRINRMMDRGNEVRQVSGRNDILALAAIGEIQSCRDTDRSALPERAFILRQIKHPEEVYTLRQVYGSGFHLLGIYCPPSHRERHLRVAYGMKEREITKLMARDEGEEFHFGQHLRDAFHFADVFFRVGEEDAEVKLAADVERFLRLLFGLGVAGPTIDEFGMFHAYAASLRSTSLARQVGAAIMTESGDLVSVGTNDVPRQGGGLYWEGDSADSRDHRRGRDSHDETKERIVTELLERTVDSWKELSAADKRKRITEIEEKLEGTRAMSLTEFSRAVHAEAEAILSAARMGCSTSGTHLFSTTFPCHTCTKYIVASGVRRLVYIEPYPKSLAYEFHRDSISLDEVEPDRVPFQPFVGIAPRRYMDLFSMVSPIGERIRRKDARGKVINDEINIRLRMAYYSSLERERVAAKELRSLTS